MPADRRKAIAAVRDAVRRNLPPGFEEGMLYGTIGWYVPKAKLERTYNGQPFAIACLANQKQYMALYLMSVYGDTALRKWFTDAWAKSGKKLDMGKACIRFESLDDVPLDVVAEAAGKVDLARWIAVHEEVHGDAARKARGAAAKKKAATKKKPAAAKKKPAAKKR